MEDFSLYVLDITMNSVRAGASRISIEIIEQGEWLDFTVTDNGCGMSELQVQKLRDPFFTTRTTRKVGLGIPFLTMLAEMTGGFVEIQSKQQTPDTTDHGTRIHGRFGRTHIDFVPLGDLSSSLTTLIQGSPDVDFVYTHQTEKGSVYLACADLRAVLGDEISLAEPEILMWIEGNLQEQYQLLK